MAHAYVRVAGHGLRLVPTAPYAIAAAGNRVEVVAEIDGVEQRISVSSSTPRGAHPYGDVLDGPDLDEWRVEVGGVYTVTWPVALQLRSWPEPDEPPFFAFGDDAGSVVYAQGPFPLDRVPALDEMIYEGQREVFRDDAGDTPLIDLAYDHKGEAWRQRHIVALLPPGRGMVITVQARRAVADALGRIGLDVARSIAPYAP